MAIAVDLPIQEDENMRMIHPQFPRISIDPAVCGGRPTVAGTRMRVTDILEMLASGASEAEIATSFPYIKAADIQTCLEFASQ